MALPEFSSQDHLGEPISGQALLRAAPLIVVLLRGFF